MADSTTSSSLVSVNSPTTFPFFKCTFLEKDTGMTMICIEPMNTIFLLDLDEIPIWNNDIAILLSFWLQQRANNDDVFRRYDHHDQPWKFIFVLILVFVQRMHILIVWVKLMLSSMLRFDDHYRSMTLVDLVYFIAY